MVLRTGDQMGGNYGRLFLSFYFSLPLLSLRPTRKAFPLPPNRPHLGGISRRKPKTAIFGASLPALRPHQQVGRAIRRAPRPETGHFQISLCLFCLPVHSLLTAPSPAAFFFPPLVSLWSVFGPTALGVWMANRTSPWPSLLDRVVMIYMGSPRGWLPSGHLELTASPMTPQNTPAILFGRALGLGKSVLSVSSFAVSLIKRNCGRR